MQNHKSEQAMHWKNKLEELDTLPGEAWDKDIAWEKLHRRFKGEPGNKKIIYRSAAIAASLVFVLALYWVMQNKSGKILTKTTVEKTNKSSPPLLQTINEESIIPANVSTIKQNKKSINNAPKIKNEVTVIIKNAMPYTLEETQFNQMKVNLTEKNNTVPAADTTSVLIERTPAKLKVVHINELGKPIVEKIKLANTPKSLQSRYKDGFSDSYSNNLNDNIFRIKLSPHN